LYWKGDLRRCLPTDHCEIKGETERGISETLHARGTDLFLERRWQCDFLVNHRFYLSTEEAAAMETVGVTGLGEEDYIVVQGSWLMFIGVPKDSDHLRPEAFLYKGREKQPTHYFNRGSLPFPISPLFPSLHIDYKNKLVRILKWMRSCNERKPSLYLKKLSVKECVGIIKAFEDGETRRLVDEFYAKEVTAAGKEVNFPVPMMSQVSGIEYEGKQWWWVCSYNRSSSSSSASSRVVGLGFGLVVGGIVTMLKVMGVVGRFSL